MQRSEITSGDVLLMRDDRMVVVDRVEDSRPINCVLFSLKLGGTLYVAAPEQFKGKIGKVDLNAFKTLTSPMESIPTLAVTSTIPTPTDSLLPMSQGKAMSMNLNIGDSVYVMFHGIKEVVQFNGFAWRRPKNPFRYVRNGRNMKGPLSMLIGKV